MNKIDEMEKATKLAAERLYKMEKELRKNIGTHTFGGGGMTEDEAFNEYLALRINPTAYQKMLQDNMKMGRDGRPLIKKEVVEAIIKMETKIKEGV